MNLFELFVINLFFIVTSSTELYNEKYRPQLHYSPPKGWMNDPNGLIFYKDNYHLFYQYWPNGTRWGPMHWGHALSKDLLHWQTLPIALYPQGNHLIFSGSTLIDSQNVTGFQPANDDNKTMVAIFTAHTSAPEVTEEQWMAYSNDEGLNWKFYENNPIIPKISLKDFRDPNIFRYGDHFVAVLVALNHIQIYTSTDLKSWTLVSTFGLHEGSHQGVWECPALFPLPTNGTETEKWVLLISTGNSTGVSTGPNMQYFIGSFDGKTFTNDNHNDTVLWVDYGPDSYAGVTYNELPDKRRIFVNWMNRWDYAESMSFNVWNGQMALPRVLNLVTDSEDRLRLSSLPVPELIELRTHSYVYTQSEPPKHSFRMSIKNMTEIGSNLLDIELSVDIREFDPKDTFGLEFSGSKDKLKVYFNGSYVIDRSNAGRHDFSELFGLVYKAPRLTAGPKMSLRLILDVSSIELFADNGLTSMTSLFLSDDNLTSDITLFYESENETSGLKNIDLGLHQLKSVWK